jgi:hypothetical protein
LAEGSHSTDAPDAIQQGLDEKSAEFRRSGLEIYQEG